MSPFFSRRALTTGALLLLCGASARAQEPVAAPPIAEAEIKAAQIQLHNVKPSLMAYWLDPARQPLPQTLKLGLRNGGNWTSFVDKRTRQPGNVNGPRGLKLPAGIASLTALDPLNVLQARGTAASLEALRKLVSELDVPLELVEIDAQIWEVAPDAAAQLPLQFLGISEPGIYEGNKTLRQTAFAMPDKITPALDALLALLDARRARLLTAPRVTAIDGSAALLTSTMRVPFVPDERAQARLDAQNAAAEPAQREMQERLDGGETVSLPAPEEVSDNWNTGLVYLGSEMGLGAAPVLHGEQIALAFRIMVNGDIAQGDAILRDGQTLAMRMPGANAQGWTRIVLIKPRILRRDGARQADKTDADG